MGIDDRDKLIMRTPKEDCPACKEKRLHTEEDWKHHPDRGKGQTKLY